MNDNSHNHKQTKLTKQSETKINQF